MKRLLISALALALCVVEALGIASEPDTTITTIGSDGQDSIVCAYKIATADDLDKFADIVNGNNGATQDTDACALVTADITANSGFTPIARADGVNYDGTFDGGGHTITLDINSTSDFQGLFGHARHCTIKNVTVKGSVTGRNHVGGIVGMLRSNIGDGKAYITNCHNYATITGVPDSDPTNGRCVGGIIGIINNEEGASGSAKTAGGETYISDCTNSGGISSNSTSGKTGGIVGYSGAQLTITRCTNSGKIAGGGQGTGGIIAMFYNQYSKALTLSYCANSGEVTSTTGDCTGSVVGRVTEGKSLSMTECYNSYNKTGLAAIGQCNATSKTLTRCYDINGQSNLTTFTADEQKSGALCYKLNGGVSDMAWHQEIGTDTIPVLTAKADEANVVNKATKTKLGEESGTAVYFNSTGSGCAINADATAFYLLSGINATDKAKENLKSGTEEGLINVLYEDSGGYYCANAVLKDKTEYSVDKAYTAAHFTYERTLASAGISTFILPAAISAGSVNGTVYKLTSYENGTLGFGKVTGTLEANTPYLVQTTGSGKALLTGTLENVEVSAMAATGVTAGGTSAATHIGSYSTQKSEDAAESGCDYYGYKGGSFVTSTKWTLSPFRTMIKVNSGGGSSGAPKSLSLQLGGEVTGMVSAELESAPVDVYAISGVKVRSRASSATALQGLPKGVYIVGGKKVVKD